MTTARLATPSRLTPINEITSRLGVTPRALRHYEEVGLIRSRRLAGNVRAYDGDTLADIEVLVSLRQVDLPMSQVREILALKPDPRAQRQAIRKILSEAIRDQSQRLEQLKALMAQQSAQPA